MARYSVVLTLVGPGDMGGGLPYQAPTPNIFFYIVVAGLLVLPALPFLVSRLYRHLHKTNAAPEESKSSGHVCVGLTTRVPPVVLL